MDTMKTIHVNTGRSVPGTGNAMELSMKTAASELGTTRDNLMIMSWFDSRAGKHSSDLLSG